MERLRTFFAERFRGEADAAAFLGGALGREAILNSEEFARALRMAGFVGPTDAVFRLLSGGADRASVAQLLAAVGPAGGVASGDLPDDPQQVAAMATAAANRQLRAEVDELRRDVAQLRVKADSYASMAQLLQERGGREVMDADIRQMSAKLEAFSRETTALRSESADVKKSLSEAWTLLAEQRKAHQNEIAENERKYRELQLWADDRLGRLESSSRNADRNIGQHQDQLKVMEQLFQQAEFRLMGLIGEEVRNRELAADRDAKLRETLADETEARWSNLLAGERAAYKRELDMLNEKVGSANEKLRIEWERLDDKYNEACRKMESNQNLINKESLQRKADLGNVFSHIDEVRGKLGTTHQASEDAHGQHTKNHESFRATMLVFMQNVEKEVNNLKQTYADLCESTKVESSRREAAVTKLEGAIIAEGKLREEGLAREARNRENAKQALEHYVSSCFGQERGTREDVQAELEAMHTTLAREQQSEKVKNSSSFQEITAALQQVRESMQSEVQSRKHDLGAQTKSLQELKASYEQDKELRDKAQINIVANVSQLAAQLRKEAEARDHHERKVLATIGELKECHGVCGQSLEEFEAKLNKRLEEERRLREQFFSQCVRSQEAANVANLEKLSAMISEDVEHRRQTCGSLEQRQKSIEQDNIAEKTAREERDKNFLARLTELSEELMDARQLIRDGARQCERVCEMKDWIHSELTHRQEHDTMTQVALKELTLRTEQCERSHEANARKQEAHVEDLHAKIDGEVRCRGIQIGEVAKVVSGERTDREAKHAEERRHLEHLLAEHKKDVKQLVEAHGNNHRNFITALQIKHEDLSNNHDELRQHHSDRHSELAQELSKLGSLIMEEAKARQSQDQSLIAEVGRIRDLCGEEQNARRKAVDGFQAELRNLMARIEELREAAYDKHKELATNLDKVHNEHKSTRSKHEADVGAVKDFIQRELHSRDEVIAGHTRSLQKHTQNTHEDLSAKLKAEVAAIEAANARVQEDLNEFRGALLESRATIEHLADDMDRRFKASAEAIHNEELARKSDLLIAKKANDEARQMLTAEHTERTIGEQHTSDRFLVIEGQLQDVSARREEAERLIAKELVELQSKVKMEQAHREEHAHRVGQELSSLASAHEERVGVEVKHREMGYASVLDTMRQRLNEEQAARQADRKELIGLLHKLQEEQHQEHENISKVCRDISATVATFQGLEKEEEENRIEQGERLGAAIEVLQEAVRSIGLQREEIVKRCLDSVDQVKASLHKEIQSRSAKDLVNDEAIRDILKRLRDETLERQAAVTTVADAVVEERAQREEAFLRERKLSEDDAHRVLQVLRKSREEEDKNMKDRLLELSATLGRERDQRMEALRQERQQTLLVKEELTRDIRTLRTEIALHGQNMVKGHEDHAQRTRAVEDMHKSHAEKLANHKVELGSKQQKHDERLQQLEQRALDLQTGLEKATKDPAAMHSDLRRFVQEELAGMNAALASDRRAREAGDLQLAANLKATLRNEADSFEARCSALAAEIEKVKATLDREFGRHDDRHSQHAASLQKITADLGEVQGTRRGDIAAIQDALTQVSEEMKNVHRQRKEDLESVHSSFENLGSRFETQVRSNREGIVETQQLVRAMQVELQKQQGVSNNLGAKFDARFSEERRVWENALAAEVNARKEALTLALDSHSTVNSEAGQKLQVAQDRLGVLLKDLTADLKKESTTNSERSRELARGIAALQSLHAGEEQARLQAAQQLQQNVDRLRDELGAQAKKTASSQQAQSDDLEKLRVMRSMLEERLDSIQRKASEDLADLRDKLAKETKSRGLGVALPCPGKGAQEDSHHETVLATGTWNSFAPKASSANNIATVAAELRELLRATEDEVKRQGRQVEGCMAEQQALSSTVQVVANRVEIVHSSLDNLQRVINDANSKPKLQNNLDPPWQEVQTLLKKEIADRKAEQEQSRRLHSDMDLKIERSEQQRLQSEDSIRQELLQTRAALKKEIRDNVVNLSAMQVHLREETKVREESIMREARLRIDGQDQLKEHFGNALREERRLREKEILRLEHNAPGNDSHTGGLLKLGNGEKVDNGGAEIRGLLHSISEQQNRLVAVEQRQKSAEERTLSMLDVIMSGLTHPVDEDQ